MVRLPVFVGALSLACGVTAATDYTAAATQHWFLSSNGDAACAVEVGSVEDVSLVLQIVAATRTPFAVYSGGHASNQGFSSTAGVHITLKRLNQVHLSEDRKIVTLGFGQGWIDVYDALEGSGVNVVGGRVPGPGVGGFTLGGGYSWKTNQYGLTCDTVKSFNVVLPNGTVSTASDEHNKDLFFALKGGLNRYGIVTSAEFYTHPQPTQVWGGLRAYPASQVSELLKLTERFFYENKDPKAGLITTLNGEALGTSAMGLFFYDGPDKPEIFDMFDGLLVTLDNTGTKPYKRLINSFPAQLVLNARGTFATFSTTELTARFMEAVRQEAEDIGRVSALHSGTMVSFDIEPFTDYGKHAKQGAFPHADSLLPLNLYFAWVKQSEDEWWYTRVRQSLATLKQVAMEEGIYEDTFLEYSNYALSDTNAEKLYGVRNAERLREIRDAIDPDRIMDLAGGHNLAPYSQFAPLTFDPPYVLFSANQNTRSGARKDTVRNVEATGKFAWSLATYELREAVNVTARPLPEGEDEFVWAGLEKEFTTVLPGDGEGNPVPMVKASPVKFECVYHSTLRLPGDGPVGTVDVVIGRVVGVHIAEWALDGRGRLDVRKTRPIARCGYLEYAVVGGEGTIFEMVIPGADEVMLAAMQGDKKAVDEGWERMKAKL
ncbi:hypothetical protein B0I37DRAFT_408919 [Chaetomium sp. MPI-CAGE-AT-0009]|nr:hypothetical protein B0I37DRAFT_408919 [Chaetomium sp. MPI-CAGE-AT-0009]